MENQKSTRFERWDLFLHAVQARFDAGLSPTALMLAYFDWALHLANSPGKQLDFLEALFEKQVKCLKYTINSSLEPECTLCVEPSRGGPSMGIRGMEKLAV